MRNALFRQYHNCRNWGQLPRMERACGPVAGAAAAEQHVLGGWAGSSRSCVRQIHSLAGDMVAWWLQQGSGIWQHHGGMLEAQRGGAAMQSR